MRFNILLLATLFLVVIQAELFVTCFNKAINSTSSLAKRIRHHRHHYHHGNMKHGKLRHRHHHRIVSQRSEHNGVKRQQNVTALQELTDCHELFHAGDRNSSKMTHSKKYSKMLASLKHELQCSRCSAGHQVLIKCHGKHDTKCELCPEGTYNNAHYMFRAKCKPCSRCGSGLFELHRCNATTDTVCDSCLTQRKLELQDYLDKCLPLSYR